MEALRRRYGSADYRAAEGVMRQVLVRVVRALSHRLRQTNQLLSSVGQLAEWLAGSLV